MCLHITLFDMSVKAVSFRQVVFGPVVHPLKGSFLSGVFKGLLNQLLIH